MSILAAPVAYLGPGTRGRLTTGAGALLGVLGLTLWSAALALVPAAGAAGDATERAGIYFDAQVVMGRVFRHELLDARLIGLLVVVAGLVLVITGRPRVAGGHPVAAPAACTVLLLVANALWAHLPGAPMPVTAVSVALGLAATLAVVRRLPGGRAVDRPTAGVPPWLALVVIGFVSGLGYAPSDSPYIRPFVSDAHVLVVFAARELVLVAAVVAACAVGIRWVGARVVVGAVVAGVGAVAYLLTVTRLVPDGMGRALIGLAGVAVLALVWSGIPASRWTRGRQAVGAALAGLVGSVGIHVLVIPGMLLMYPLVALAGTSNDDTGPITFGCGIVHALVLVAVHRWVERDAVRPAGVHP